MMKPLDTADNLDVDISSIGFVGDDADPQVYWRRVAGAAVTFDVNDIAGMGIKNETVIRVGVRYHYQSILSNLFGGAVTTMERVAFARPRVERVITLDGKETDGGNIVYFGS
jgi:hypothetical protein